MAAIGTVEAGPAGFGGGGGGVTGAKANINSIQTLYLHTV